MNLLTYVITSPQIGAHTKAVTLTALVKLSDRYPHLAKYVELFCNKILTLKSEIQAFVSKYKNVQELDMQQRSCEFSNLFSWPDIRFVSFL